MEQSLHEGVPSTCFQTKEMHPPASENFVWTPSLLGLPHDMLSNVVSYLDPISLAKCEVTCGRLNNIGRHSWSTLDSIFASKDLMWNECSPNSNPRTRAIRCFRVIKFADRIDSLIEKHFRSPHGPDGYMRRRLHTCQGCEFPSQLNLDWVKHPDEYEYFVRIAIGPRGMTSKTKSFLFQGIFAHASATFHVFKLGCRQLNIDLRDWNGSGELDYMANNLGCKMGSDGRLNVPGRGCGLVTTVVAIRKSDLKMSLMYGSNRISGMTTHRTESGFTVEMSEIRSRSTHPTTIGQDPLLHTCTFGELVFFPERNQFNSHTGNGPWQMRLGCRSYDDCVFTPDLEEMAAFYHSFHGDNFAIVNQI